MEIAANDNEQDDKPFGIFLHGRKFHTWGALHNADKHNKRDPSVDWLGENIDLARTPLNETLVGSGDVVADIKTRLAEIGLTPKPGQVIAREVLLTAGSRHFEGEGYTGRDGSFRPDRLEAWKAAAVEFLRAEFGDNLVACNLHLDESVPHAHCFVTTAVKVEKKGRGRPRKDGIKAAPVMGWTFNHDLVFGSGKDALSKRQDRHGDHMAPLGLRRGRRYSKAHHQPIKEFYAELPEKLAAAEADRLAARDLRLQAEQDAIRAQILSQAGEAASQLAREAQAAAERSRRMAEARHRDAEQALARARRVEQEQLNALAAVDNERQILAAEKRQMAAFMERQGQSEAFEQYRADTLAVANLRQGRGKEWEAYEQTLRVYADDLKWHGTWREAMVRRADKPLRYLFEAGAQALGHASIAVNPARLVSDGVRAWLRLVGGEEMVRLHRTVVGWMREMWITTGEIAIEPRQRGRERGE